MGEPDPPTTTTTTLARLTPVQVDQGYSYLIARSANGDVVNVTQRLRHEHELQRKDLEVCEQKLLLCEEREKRELAEDELKRMRQLANRETEERHEQAREKQGAQNAARGIQDYQESDPDQAGRFKRARNQEPYTYGDFCGAIDTFAKIVQPAAEQMVRASELSVRRFGSGVPHAHCERVATINSLTETLHGAVEDGTIASMGQLMRETDKRGMSLAHARKFAKALGEKKLDALHKKAKVHLDKHLATELSNNHTLFARSEPGVKHRAVHQMQEGMKAMVRTHVCMRLVHAHKNRAEQLVWSSYGRADVPIDPTA